MLVGDYTTAVKWRDETGVIKHGTLINTAYCAVTNRWQILVLEDGSGMFRNIHAEGLEVQGLWFLEEWDGDMDLDDEDEDEDED